MGIMQATSYTISSGMLNGETNITPPHPHKIMIMIMVIQKSTKKGGIEKEIKKPWISSREEERDHQCHAPQNADMEQSQL